MGMTNGGFRPNSGRKKGSIPWNKGIPMREESRIRLSKSLKGRPSSNKGVIASPETRAKQRLAKLGKPTGRKGMKLPPEWVEKIGLSKKGKAQSDEHKMANRQGQYNRYIALNPDYEVNSRNGRIAKNGGFYSEKEWETLKEKYNWMCPSCKKKEPEIKLSRDHILPLVLGGRNDIENIQPLCLQCNIKKHTQTIRY